MKVAGNSCLIRLYVVIFCSVFYVGNLFADTMNLDYGDFYSHLKKLDEEDTPALQFSFGFLHVSSKRLCNIQDVNIITQKQTMEVIVNDENRFQLPVEKALKQARAIVEVILDDNSHQCDMSVQLETKPDYLKASYSAGELAAIYHQYETFFDDMGGLFSFLMPEVSGLVLHFDSATNIETNLLDTSLIGTNLKDSKNLLVEENKITLSKAFLEGEKQLTLPIAPRLITAKTSK